jgi:hypothetical protein
MAEESSSIQIDFKIKRQISIVKFFFDVKTTLLENFSRIHFRTGPERFSDNAK